MLDQIANLFLLFSHPDIFIPGLIFGYIWLDKVIYQQTLSLVLISMIVNTALKSTFQIPLSPLLNKEGFSFPSGHMHAAIVLYGWLYTKIKNTPLHITIALLLPGIAASLIYFGYHNLFDVIGAVFAGTALIFAYNYLIKHTNPLQELIIILIFIAILMVYINIVYTIKYNGWMACSGLYGFQLATYLLHNKPATTITITNKLTSSIIILVVFLLLNNIFKNTTFELLQNLKWLIFGCAIPYARHFGKIITRN